MSEEIKTDDYIQQLPPVAKRLYLFCKKCDSNRYFMVLAHKTERSARLECEGCKAKKSFTIKKTKNSKKKQLGLGKEQLKIAIKLYFLKLELKMLFLIT